ncbi:DUF418 domain-containing protein [Oceanobacillus sp. FSL K6-2867]|uniref:DUF418 domain-containing protein n=1 Tax=Oceanobacillus sp. FSL K6-2867 TaxID=2954748 RepID=UPI0030D94F52
MKRRVSTIDGLRGFSLLGILIANMLIFQYGIFGKDNPEHFQLSPLDTVAYVWTKIFVEASFLPVFMFLFGYSLVKLKEKLERNQLNVKRHLVRRFLLFFVFGLLHSIFIWEGDILLAYSLIGFLMILFINRKRKTLLVWAIILFALTSLMGFGEVEQTEKDIQLMESYIQGETEAYSSDRYADALAFRQSGELPFDLPEFFYVLMLVFTPLLIAPLTLLGMYAAKRNWFTNPKQERKWYIRGALGFGITGLLLKSFHYLIPNPTWTEGAYSIGAILLALGYIFGFATLYTRETGKLMSTFEKVGRLSLTNYLTQSFICTAVFYGYGLGLYSKLGVFLGILLALVIFAAQMVCSQLYLKFFKMGPFENIMRIGSYFSWKGQIRQKREKGKSIA